MNCLRLCPPGLFPRLRAVFVGLVLLLAGLHASWAASLHFAYEYGTPAQATGKPAYPYTGFSEYFSTVTSVTITSSDSSAPVYYTIDGTEPTTASPQVTGKIAVLRKLVIKAMVVDSVTGLPVVRTENVHATGMISAGYSHALALPFTGTPVYAWGDNTGSKLGLNVPSVSTADQSTKITVTDTLGTGLTNIKAVEAGGTFSLALTHDGLVKSWGAYSYGQLGINADTSTAIQNENRIGTVKVKGTSNTLQDVRDIIAGEAHALAIVGSTGQLWGWGRNSEGALGIGTPTGYLSDQTGAVATINVAGNPLTNVTQAAAGKNHSAALVGDGDIYAWGYNYFGQVLGTTGTADNVFRATQMTTFYPGVSPLIPAKARAIACGDHFTVAVRSSDGTVWGWGVNTNGQLGNGATAASQLLPVQVMKSAGVPLTDIVQIEAGISHCIALDSSGVVWTWGLQTGGRLGNGLTTAANKWFAASVAVLPVNSTDHVIAVAAGTDYSMALTEKGSIYTWGSRVAGRLGDGFLSGSNATPATNTYLPLPSNQPPVVSFLSINATTAYRSTVFSPVLGATDQDNNLTNLDLLVDGVIFQSFASAPTLAVNVPNLTVGSHTFTLQAVDAAGFAATPVSLNVTVLAPTVTLTLQTASTIERTSPGGSTTPGKFRFAVSPVQTTDLPLSVTISGSAINGTDYQTISTPISIPPGQAYVDVNVAPIFDRLNEGTETVTLTLNTNSEYIRGGSVFARTVSLEDRPPVRDPVVQFDRGTNTRLPLVAVTWTDASATIRYTTNGTDPTPSSPALSATAVVDIAGPTFPVGSNIAFLRVPVGATLKLKGSATNKLDSEVVTRVLNGKALVAAGETHSFAVTPDGKTWAWGRNDYGQLGLGDTLTYRYPHYVSTLPSPLSIAAADTFSVAALEDGHAVIWGTFGSFSSLTPVRFQAQSADVTDIVQVAASSTRILLRKSNGSLLEYSSGNPTAPLTPGLTNVVDIAAGGAGLIALKNDGTVWQWSASPAAPVQVQTGVVQISAGMGHFLGLHADTKLVIWGDNSQGQHGSNWQIPLSELSGFFTVAAGGDTTFGANLEGFYCNAGANDHGQRALGGTSAVNGIPYSTTAPPFLSAMCLGLKHGLAVEDNGAETTFWSWGWNSEGQLGTNDLPDRYTPVEIVLWYIDSDNDGLPDSWENLYGLDPNTDDSGADADGDGLTNLEEYQLETDPTSTDSDSDGMPDKWEVDRSFDPTVADGSKDADYDGASNLIEYQLGTDPHVYDTDADTIPDGAEINMGLDPTYAGDAEQDPDKDHVSNIQEYVRGTNPWPVYVGEIVGNLSGVLVSKSAGPAKIVHRGAGDEWIVRDAKTWAVVQTISANPASTLVAVNANGMVAGANVIVYEDLSTGTSSGNWSNGTFTALNDIGANPVSEVPMALSDTGCILARASNGFYKFFGYPELLPVAVNSSLPVVINSSLEIAGNMFLDGLPWTTGFLILANNQILEINSGANPVISQISENGTVAGTFWTNPASGSNLTLFTFKPDRQIRNLVLPGGQKEVVAVDSFGQVIYRDGAGKLKIARGRQAASLQIKDWTTTYADRALGTVYGASEDGTIVCELISAPGVNPPLPPVTFVLRTSFVDTDGDGMPDDWEKQWGLNPNVYDAADDKDGDGVTNYQEFLGNTNPSYSDTDGDGLPDLWEIQNGLNPQNSDDGDDDPDNDSLLNLYELQYGTNPQLADTDLDLMPDGWEIEKRTDPLVADGTADPDADGLSNLGEYQAETDPFDPDFDSDSIPDGWEVTHHLDPLTASDAGEDPDGDSLTNRQEYTLNHNPWPTYAATELTGLAEVFAVSRSAAAPMLVGKDATGQIVVQDVKTLTTVASFPSVGVTIKGVNKHGDVVGSLLQGNPAVEKAGVWRAGVFTEIPYALAGWTSIATAINDQGQVVGTAHHSSLASIAFLWNIDSNDFEPLTTPWPDIEPIAINNAGVVAGNVMLPAEEGATPTSNGFVIRDGQAELVQVGVVTSVGALSETGTVAGVYSSTLSSAPGDVYRYTAANRIVRYTNSLARETVAGVNGSGQILGVHSSLSAPPAVDPTDMFVVRGRATTTGWLAAPATFDDATLIRPRGYSEAEVFVHEVTFDAAPRNFLFKRVVLINDQDGDEMNDEWEDKWGLDKTDPTDASRRLDGGGRTALEYLRDGDDPEMDPVDSSRWQTRTRTVLTQVDYPDGSYDLHWETDGIGTGPVDIRRQKKDGTWVVIATVPREDGFYHIPPLDIEGE